MVPFLKIPVCGSVMRPFGVAGEGARYIRRSFSFMQEKPCNRTFWIALIIVVTGRLKKFWCVNFTFYCLYCRV